MKEQDLTLDSEPPQEYKKDISEAKSLDELRQVLDEWVWCAEDALEIAERMRPNNFGEFQAGLLRERSGVFAGESWARKYMDILMPSKMFKASMVAEQYQVPWFVAWMRMKASQPSVEGK